MPRGIYKRKQMNDFAPRTFVDTLIAGFNEPEKAIQSLKEVAKIYQNEANQLQIQYNNVMSKIKQINELENALNER